MPRSNNPEPKGLSSPLTPLMMSSAGAGSVGMDDNDSDNNNSNNINISNDRKDDLFLKLST
ncbi:unnamed protein product [Trichobilharzia regenti]|nr:unnamed protein product [Trichobilharzia regenti]